MAIEKVDCVVIGGGIIGLSIARKMAIEKRSVLLLEQENTIGTGISSRNSEVIHAGIYYPSNSLKARFCRAGKEMLYAYAKERGINYKNCSKLIVATNESQHKALAHIKKKAEDNGVYDLSLVSSTDAQSIESELYCTSALLSPSTGIIDTHGLMISLQGDLENYGGICAFNAQVLSCEFLNCSIKLNIKCAQDNVQLVAKTVINAAGLGAIPLVKKFKGFPSQKIPQEYYAKGNYYSYVGKNPFSHLIYPVPETAGLGIHLTFDLSGKARFGPDVEWVNKIDYTVNEERVNVFYTAIRSYWPNIEDNSLVPDYSGIRPKVSGADEAAKDFLIQDFKCHGIHNLVNLFGIESPGLTSSLAIAEYVANSAS